MAGWPGGVRWDRLQCGVDGQGITNYASASTEDMAHLLFGAVARRRCQNMCFALVHLRIMTMASRVHEAWAVWVHGQRIQGLPTAPCAVLSSLDYYTLCTTCSTHDWDDREADPANA